MRERKRRGKDILVVGVHSEIYSQVFGCDTDKTDFFGNALWNDIQREK